MWRLLCGILLNLAAVRRQRYLLRLMTILRTTDGAVHGSAIGQPNEHFRKTDFRTA